ncbi:hypothetical protein HMSSN036_05470 [Paenibacillus macerans]|nr:hypothetical protein HMSSN036_05470 [Paenibacillus macerans]
MGIGLLPCNSLTGLRRGMGLPEGYFYEMYIDECFFQAAPDWRRLGPFLQRCAELNKLDCIEQSVRLMMDNLAYIPLLFNLAEQFFMRTNGKRLLYFMNQSQKVSRSSILSGWRFANTGCLR